MTTGIVEVLDSLGTALITTPDDWSLDHRMAWVYGILVGWDDALPEVAAKHHWDEETVKRLRTYREIVGELQR